MAGNGQKKKLAESSSRLVIAVELARKVTRPLTFFAAIGLSLIGIIPIVYWMTPNDVKLAIALTTCTFECGTKHRHFVRPFLGQG